jgi:hypothetical protein
MKPVLFQLFDGHIWLHFQCANLATQQLKPDVPGHGRADVAAPAFVKV